MKADLRGTPSIEPEVRLHASGFLAGAGVQVILRDSLVRNLALLGEPGAEIDEPTTIAAERPELRCRHPLHIAPAGWTFDYRRHRAKESKT
jgi:hypothetical protein